MKKWEYLVVSCDNAQPNVESQSAADSIIHWWKRWGMADATLNNRSMHQVFNMLGQDGWELVTVDHHGRFYFKRLLSET